jgi:hypothetical protein
VVEMLRGKKSRLDLVVVLVGEERRLMEEERGQE